MRTRGTQQCARARAKRSRFLAARGPVLGRGGVAALEFALVTPVLLFMLLAMICFGAYLVFLHELQELSSSAARSSVAGLNETERNNLAEQFVTDAVSRSAILNPNDLTVTTATSGTPPIDYSVTVSYTLKDTPIPMLAALIKVPFSDISRTSTIQFGGY
ncbi:MAG TPA: TadE/TadG family type IV pilus assembly protein [Acetobacteraceae bacterium]|nr:TadE/TadG family type IV pilus assembly protein [Acetobacteraceae bacterium]